MKTYKVLLTEKAENDVIDIKRYISVDLHEPENALRLVQKFHETIEGLSALPSRFSYVADEVLALKGIHKVVIDNYIIFFGINEKEQAVHILRVLYYRRDWASLL